MLKNYFLLAWRNLRKHKSSAMINIGGLTLGLTTSLLVLFYLVDEISYDKFHKNIPDLYLLLKNQKESDGINTGRSSAGPMAPALRSEFPEVVNAVRDAPTGTVARIADKRIEIDGIYYRYWLL